MMGHPARAQYFPPHFGGLALKKFYICWEESPDYMKQLLIIFIFLSNIFLANAQLLMQRNHDKMIGEKRIKSETVYSQYVTVDAIDKKVHQKSYKEYNESGDLISDTDFTNDSINVKKTYKYDSGRNRIEEKTFFTESGLTSDHKWTYNESGKVIKEEIIRDDTLINDILYSYLADGILTEKTETAYLKDGSHFLKRYKYKYDSSQRLIEEAIYYENGELNCSNNYEYDEEGRLALIKQLSDKGKILSKKKIKYDKNGIPKENVVRDPQGAIIKEYQTIGSIDEEHKYKYDNKGNVVEEEILNAFVPGGGAFSKLLTYTYDNTSCLTDIREKMIQRVHGSTFTGNYSANYLTSDCIYTIKYTYY